jgi:DNA-binding NarL/FixJ family response regulator
MADQRVITIALVEDNHVVRAGLIELLNRVPDFEVVFADAYADFARIEQANPRVILLDIGLEHGDSLSAARTMGEELPESGVIMMDLLPADEDIRDFIEAGVAGFVLKDDSLEDFVNAIRSVAGGSHVLPAEVTSTLFSQIANAAVASDGPKVAEDVGLTPREREVLRLISDGLSNKKIAARLQISSHTVKSHVRNIMEKLTLHTRLELAAWAHEEAS